MKTLTINVTSDSTERTLTKTFDIPDQTYYALDLVGDERWINHILKYAKNDESEFNDSLYIIQEIVLNSIVKNKFGISNDFGIEDLQSNAKGIEISISID